MEILFPQKLIPGTFFPSDQDFLKVDHQILKIIPFFEDRQKH
ncbi:hypothetical protein Nmel_006860 [Mimus melanotis]